MKPFNNSGRTKAQIVRYMETGPLASLIIETTDGIHLEACHCEPCFQKKLDALVSKSEEATNDLQSDSVGSLDSHQL